MNASRQFWPRKTRELHSHHFDSTVWNDFAFRDDDIVIGTNAKSGTTWTQQIVGQLIFSGEPEVNVAEVSPWIDLRVPPKAVKLAAVEAQTHRRFLKTHLPVDALVFSHRPNTSTSLATAATWSEPERRLIEGGDRTKITHLEPDGPDPHGRASHVEEVGSGGHGGSPREKCGRGRFPAASKGGQARLRFSANAPSPSRAWTTRVTAQNAGNSQPPPSFEKKKPAAPCGA